MDQTSAETVLDLLHRGDQHTAVVVPELDISVSYHSLREQVLAMADALAAAGVRRGDRVASALPNGLPAIVTFLAASIAGSAAPLNPHYPYEEYLFFLQDTSARLLICPRVGGEEVREAASDCRIPTFPVEMSADGRVHLLDIHQRGSA